MYQVGVNILGKYLFLKWENMNLYEIQFDLILKILIFQK